MKKWGLRDDTVSENDPKKSITVKYVPEILNSPLIKDL